MDSSDFYEDYKKIELDEFLDLEQTLISKKDKHNVFSVERQYINSKLFHDKFTKLPVNKEVQESIYRQTGRLLEFVDSLDEDKMSQERLLAIDARTGEFIVDNFNRDGETHKTGFSYEEYKIVEKCLDSIILIHNHSLNGRPSAQDLLVYLHNEKVRISLIACHDGTLYGIYGVSKEFENRYHLVYNKFKGQMSDENDIKRLVMTELYLYNDKLSEKKKLFHVEKL